VQVVDGLVEEDLGKLGGALLGGDAAVGDRLVGVNEGVVELLGSLHNSNNRQLSRIEQY
jgi:hypothetical protein